mmetsp:Transcript_44753/g.74097  ORF Transcript_44753/g.74097 Transcript_44753/m.74097 type:complete len:225 (+) Transcript_44753:305-979(+)
MLVPIRQRYGTRFLFPAEWTRFVVYRRTGKLRLLFAESQLPVHTSLSILFIAFRAEFRFKSTHIFLFFVARRILCVLHLFVGVFNELQKVIPSTSVHIIETNAGCLHCRYWRQVGHCFGRIRSRRHRRRVWWCLNRQQLFFCSALCMPISVFVSFRKSQSWNHQKYAISFDHWILDFTTTIFVLFRPHICRHQKRVSIHIASVFVLLFGFRFLFCFRFRFRFGF